MEVLTMAKAKSIMGLSTHTSTAINARIIARTRLEELSSWDEYVSFPYATRELHDLRIAAKRFRYTLEIFAAVLPPACKTALAEVEQIQEELGSLHDSDVLIALLRLCLGSWDAGTGYVTLLAHVQNMPIKGRLLINPDLLACFLDGHVAPSERERAGLEQLLSALHVERGKQYAAFSQHWQTLKDRNFFRGILAILAD
jgi:hypothetical protein